MFDRKITPVIKSVPKNLQVYLQERLSDKIAELQQLGGDIEWDDTSVILTGTDKHSIDDFVNNVLNPLEEKVDQISEDHWKKLNSKPNSFLPQLINKFPVVKIILDPKNNSITFIGLNAMVKEARNRLFQEIYQELCLLE